MKILIDTHHFWPAVGGIERFVATLAEGLAAEGHEVLVLTRTPVSMREPAWSGFDVIRDSDWTRQGALLRDCDVAVFNSVQLRAIPMLIRHRVPFVHVVHSLAGGFTGRSDGPGANGLQDFVRREAFIRRARAVVVPSNFMRDALPYRSHVIPHSLPDSWFDSPSTRETRSGVVSMGRMVSGKGFDVLLDAWAHVRETVRSREGVVPPLTLIGSGDKVVDFRQRVSRLGWREVTIPGACADLEELRAALARHVVGVVPSVKPEAFGLAALELQAAGCALISTNVGALPEAVGQGAALVPPADPEALAAALSRLLTAPEEVSLLRERGQDNVAGHTMKKMSHLYAQLLTSVARTPAV